MPDALPTDWQLASDEVEGAFTAAVPAGWRHRVRLLRRGQAVHTLVEAASPSERTSMFAGDPSIPPHVEPGAFPPPPGYAVHPFVPVDGFLPGWIGRAFGALPGFAPGPMAPYPPLAEAVYRAAVASGAPSPYVTAARADVGWDGPIGRVRGVILATCTRFGGMWVADVHGVTSVDDPGAFVPALLRMVTSRAATRATAEAQLRERRAAAAAHTEAMRGLDRNAAVLRGMHASAMEGIRASSAAHAARMEDLHAAADLQARRPDWTDAVGRAHADGEARDDAMHRRFLNLVAGEETVVDPEGQVHQVEEGFDRYFRRRRDGAWVGIRGDRDLSGMPGIDPADFDEARIRR